VGRADYQHSVAGRKEELISDMAADRQPSNSRPMTVRRIGVQTIYVLLGNVFTIVVGWPLQIYVSRVLGPTGVGIYGLLEAGVGTAVGLLGFGIGQTTLRFVPAHFQRGEYGHVLALIRIGVLTLLMAGGLGLVLLVVSLAWIGELWPAMLPYRWEIGTMGILIPLGLLGYFLQQCLRAFQEIGYMILGTSVVQLALKAILTVVVFAVGWRIEGYILASVAATFCGVLWMAGGVVRKVRDLPRSVLCQSALSEWRRFALITLSGGLLGAATSGLDRFILGAFLGTGAVGVLIVARQLQQLPERFNHMLLTVGTPMFSAAHSGDEAAERQHLYGLMTGWSVSASLPLILFLLLFGHEVLALYGDEFADWGATPLRILLGAQLLSLLCGPVGNVALMSGLERHCLGVDTVSIGLSTALLLFLVPSWGLLGAAAASALGIVFSNVAVMTLVRCKLRLHWWDRRYLAWLSQGAAALGVGVSGVMWLDPTGAAGLITILMAMYAVAAGATVLRGLHNDERDLLHHIWDRSLGRAY
jgi:O-antigen/teichoic acid export membrane protein